MAHAHDPAARSRRLPSEHSSLWIEEEPGTPASPLEEDLAVDTAVVGGGICGVTAAARLNDHGQTVALLEADRLLRGVTGHTTAKLTSQHGLVYDELISTFGRRQAEQYADANQTAIRAVADHVDREDVACNFHRASAFTYVETEERVDELHAEVEAARELGLPATFVEDPPLPFEVPGAVRFDDQAHFHPRSYLLALAEEIDAGDSAVYERTRVVDVDDGDPCRLETRDHTVEADDVIVATHFPVFDRALYFARLRPKKSYVLAARLEGRQPRGMHYRDADPIFSIRPMAGVEENLVLFTGQNHRPGEADEADRYRRLEATVRSHFEVASIEYRWSTQDFVSFDHVPFVGPLGPLSDHVYVATGFGGWGMTNGIAAGRMLADAILGDPPEQLEVFDPARVNARSSAGSFLAHNAHAAKSFVADRLRRFGKPTESDLDPGEGRIVRRNGQTIAAYRDEEGHMHTLSAICTHMGCEVKWNQADETWDCPCHGSRFAPEGEVIDGPAIEGLEEEDV